MKERVLLILLGLIILGALVYVWVAFLYEPNPWSIVLIIEFIPTGFVFFVGFCLIYGGLFGGSDRQLQRGLR